MLCKDSSWATKQVFMKNINQILFWEEHSEAAKMLRMLCNRSNITIYTQKTLKKEFGLNDDFFVAICSADENTCKQDYDRRLGQDLSQETAFHLRCEDSETDMPEKLLASEFDHETSSICQLRTNTLFTPLIYDTLDVLERLETLLERWDDVKNNYSSELSAIDLMVSDELHYAEFESLSAVDGYMSYKRLHNLLIKRRQCKNEYLVSTAARSIFTLNIDKALNHALSTIHGLETRIYEPRVYWPGKSKDTNPPTTNTEAQEDTEQMN